MCNYLHLRVVDVKDLNLLYSLVTVTPFHHYSRFTSSPLIPQEKKVEDIGVEPMTPCVQGRCSSQLS